MTGLRRPPTRERSARVFLRLIVLVMLLAIAAGVIWTAVTLQRIDLVETTSLASLERGEVVEVQGLGIHVNEGEGGPVPVVILHDFDVAGSVLLADLAARIEGPFRPVAIDLPGFGLSQRVPDTGTAHTVAGMAEIVASILDDRYDAPVVALGVGLGGEVAAELAVTHPELLAGLVMVDVEFEPDSDWVSGAEGLPYVGPAVVHAFEAGGPFAQGRWAPRCDDGGWCPTAEELFARDRAAKVAGTTESLVAFLATPRSSLVPSELDMISVPSAYVWSSAGDVPRQAVEDVVGQVPEMTLIETAVWKAHLEDPASVIDAIARVVP